MPGYCSGMDADIQRREERARATAARRWLVLTRCSHPDPLPEWDYGCYHIRRDAGRGIDLRDTAMPPADMRFTLEQVEEFLSLGTDAAVSPPQPPPR